MKSVLIFILLFFTSFAHAGRSGLTEISSLIVKPGWIEIGTASSGGCGTVTQRWHLLTSHPNYEALYAGLLASKTAKLKVDIVGNGVCGLGEDVGWAYILVE